MLGAITTMLGGLAIWFALCRSRTDEVFLAATERIAVGLSRDEVDALLLPSCERLVDVSTESRYQCRPSGEGICSCAPTMVLMVDLVYSASNDTEAQRVAWFRLWDVGGLSKARAPEGAHRETLTPCGRG